jgi:hypothetical protein
MGCSCHFEEPSDEAILRELYGVRDCLAAPRLPSGGQVAMTPYIASIFGNNSTR